MRVLMYINVSLWPLSRPKEVAYGWSHLIFLRPAAFERALPDSYAEIACLCAPVTRTTCTDHWKAARTTPAGRRECRQRVERLLALVSSHMRARGQNFQTQTDLNCLIS